MFGLLKHVGVPTGCLSLLWQKWTLTQDFQKSHWWNIISSGAWASGWVLQMGPLPPSLLGWYSSFQKPALPISLLCQNPPDSPAPSRAFPGMGCPMVSEFLYFFSPYTITKLLFSFKLSHLFKLRFILKEDLVITVSRKKCSPCWKSQLTCVCSWTGQNIFYSFFWEDWTPRIKVINTGYSDKFKIWEASYSKAEDNKMPAHRPNLAHCLFL